MMLAAFCAAVLFIVIFPDTPTGKFLRRMLVERPAQKLSELTFGRVALGIILAGSTVAALMVMRAFEDGAAIGLAIPEGVTWLAAFDFAAYIDVIALLWIVAANVRVRAALEASRWAVSKARQWVLRILPVLGRGFPRTGHSARRQPKLCQRSDAEDGDAGPSVFGFA